MATVAAREFKPEYVWQWPGTDCCVHLQLAAAAQIRADLSAASAVSREPRAGLLIGQVTKSTVHVGAFEPLTTAEMRWYFDRPGPAQAAFRRSVQGRPDEKVVGFFEYRPPVAGPPELDELLALDVWFGSAVPVRLNIRTDRSAPAGGIDVNFVAPEVPAVEVARPPVPVRASRKPIDRSSIIAWVLAAFAAGSAVMLYTRPDQSMSSGKEAQPRTVFVGSPLSLSASQMNGDVIVTWDSKHSAIADARIGAVSIHDGGTLREFALTRAQIQSELLRYTPRTNQLQVRLELYSGAGTPVSETLSVVVLPEQVSRGRSVGAQTLAVSPAPLTPAAVPALVPASSAAQQVPAAPRVFTALKSPAQAKPQEALLTDVPALTAPTNLAEGRLPVVTTLPAPPQNQIPLAPTRQSSPTVTAPQVVRRSKPVVPRNVLLTLKRPTKVQVRVTIDPNGKVVAAEPFAPSGALPAYLGNSAAIAAREWTFVPAKRGNAPVTSELVLEFLFGPEN